MNELEEMEKAQKLKAAQSRKDWRAVMALPEGRRVLKEILDSTRYRSSPFDKHGSVMSANIGKMEIGLGIDKKIAHHCPPEEYIKLFNRSDELV